MRNTMLAVILMSGMAASPCAFAQTRTGDLAQLERRVAQLEKQLQEISQLVEPLKAQQAIDTRRNAFRDKFEKKMAQDSAKYTPDQLREAEELYQVANRKWGTPEASESLQTMLKKYPDINRTGCATLYVAQQSQGGDRVRYLRDCIEKFNDCFYGDGVQVGAYARFLLAQDYRARGEDQKAQALFTELKASYPDAIDHGGKLLVDAIVALNSR